MCKIPKLSEQELAADAAFQNVRFLVASTDDHEEKKGLQKVADGLHTLLDVYRTRIALLTRQEQLKIISLSDYQDAKAR